MRPSQATDAVVTEASSGVRAGSLAAPIFTPTALRIVCWALAFRVLSAALAFLANVTFPLYQEEQFTVLPQTHKVWDTFARFDSGWYFLIARSGYYEHMRLAFFPLYPMSMGALGRLLGGRRVDFYLAGILISWAAFAGAMVLLYRLARLDLSEAGATRSLVFTALFPFAIFYGVVYTESLFLLLTLASVYCFRMRRWELGGLAGGLACLTRANGLLALPALAWLGWRNAGSSWTERGRVVGALALVIGGLGGYCLYSYSLTGSYLGWVYYIHKWNYYPGGAPWGSLPGLARAIVTRPYDYLTGEAAAPYQLLNGGAALVLVVALPFIWARFGAGYGLWVLVNLWVPLSSGWFEGLGRYCSVIFPFFLWLGTFESPAVKMTIVSLSAMLYMLCLALFTTLHPIF